MVRTRSQKEHVRALGPHPQYPARFKVPSAMSSWSSSIETYNPVEFTHEDVIKACDTWADPTDPGLVDFTKRKSFVVEVLSIDSETNRPVNPMGRTGMVGRGLLGKWGPNHAADPIVTRMNPITENFEMIAIKRRDTKEWAIPGGMVDQGEVVSQTLLRELYEEAVSGKEQNGLVINTTFEDLKRMMGDSKPILIYQGYVDDPRNTDNAWMETSVYWFHLNCKGPVLNPASDAIGAKWVTLPLCGSLPVLYASHTDFVAKVVARATLDPRIMSYGEDRYLDSSMTKRRKVVTKNQPTKNQTTKIEKPLHPNKKKRQEMSSEDDELDSKSSSSSSYQDNGLSSVESDDSREDDDDDDDDDKEEEDEEEEEEDDDDDSEDPAEDEF